MRFTAGVRMIQFYMLIHVVPSASDESACDRTALNATLPSELQALSGMCLLVPCSFDAVSPATLDVNTDILGIWLKSTHHFGPNPESIIFNSGSREKYPIEMVGNLAQKNCTTRFHNVTTNETDNYYFRVENDPYKATDICHVLKISVSESAPAPSIRTEDVLAENREVSFTCQALNPCPSRPPRLSWNIAELHGVGREQHELGTNASLQGNVILSDRHDGQKLTCSAVYPPKDSGGDTRVAEHSVTLNVSYSPKETEALVEETGQLVTLTCISRANPPVDEYTWFRRTESRSENVYEGHQYSFNKSSSEYIFYCMATNPSGYQNSTDVKITTFSKVSLLVGGLFGIALFICVMICVLCLWKKRSSRQQPQGSAMQLEAEIHYGEIDFTKRDAAVQKPARAQLQGGEVTSEYAEITPGKARNAHSS